MGSPQLTPELAHTVQLLLAYVNDDENVCIADICWYLRHFCKNVSDRHVPGLEQRLSSIVNNVDILGSLS